jgi:hypothetical protein
MGLVVKTELQDERWWVWLGSRRLIGFREERSAKTLAENISNELKDNEKCEQKQECNSQQSLVRGSGS